MKTLTRLSAVFFLVLMLPTNAEAQTEVAVGPRIGIDVGDVEEVFIGADARITSPSLPVVVNPTFDYYFTPDGFTFWGLSGNALYPFGIDNQQFTPYAGGGLGIYSRSVDAQFGSASSTDLGLNLLFGIQFPLESVRPFAEAQFTPVFADGSYNLFSIKGGLLFSF
ncbi:MAG: hypothetical protein ACLFTE_04065 [Salinivenus sp.]